MNSTSKIDIVLPVYGKNPKDSLGLAQLLISDQIRQLSSYLDIELSVAAFDPETPNATDFFALPLRTDAIRIFVFSLANAIQLGFVPAFLSMAGIPIRAKERGYDTGFVFGGGLALLNAIAFDDLFDVVFRGNSLKPLNAFIMALAGKLRDRMEDTHIRINPESSLASDYRFKELASLPSSVLQRSLAKQYFYDEYAIDAMCRVNPPMPGQEVYSLVATLGCQYSCPFCQPCLTRFQHLSLTDIARSLDCVRESQIPTVFWPSLSLSSHPQFDELLNILDAPKFGDILHVFGSFRAEELSTKRITKLSKLNFTHTYSYHYKRELGTKHPARFLALAPETGSAQVAKKLGKPKCPEAVRRVIHDALQVGINYFNLYFMLNHPYESAKDLHLTVEYMAQIAERVGRSGGQLLLSVNPFIPMPGTVHSDLPITSPDDWFASVEMIKSSLQDHLDNGTCTLVFLPYSVAVLQYAATRLSPNRLDDLLPLYAEYGQGCFDLDSPSLSYRAWSLL